MTVAELIEQLEELVADGYENSDVKITYNYNDYWKTTVATDIENIDTGYTEWSGYHDMEKVSDDSENSKQVVLLF